MGLNLSDKALALWGKKTVEDGQELWLPLIAHMIDTKNVINWLYNHWLSDGQRFLLQGELAEEESQNRVKFLGFIHDIGKASIPHTRGGDPIMAVTTYPLIGYSPHTWG